MHELTVKRAINQSKPSGDEVAFEGNKLTTVDGERCARVKALHFGHERGARSEQLEYARSNH